MDSWIVLTVAVVFVEPPFKDTVLHVRYARAQTQGHQGQPLSCLLPLRVGLLRPSSLSSRLRHDLETKIPFFDASLCTAIATATAPTL